MKEMKQINVQSRGPTSFVSAERIARRVAAKEIHKPMLLSWFDGDSGAAGPLETCSDEPRSCSVSYARNRDASHHVVVDRRYEFFYVSSPHRVQELDPQQVVEVHRGLERSAYDNLQGG